VIEVNDSRPFPPQELLQHVFSFEERQKAKILPVQVKEIKCEEDALPFSEQKVFERWPAGIIDTRDLPIENGPLNFDVFSEPGGELGKTAECVSIPGDQFPSAVFQVRQCAESIDFQFVYEIIRVEGF